MSKVMISMPENVLADVDRTVAELGTSRSAWLTDAARQRLARPDPAALRAVADRMQARFADIEASDTTEYIRMMRDSR